jgi:hypothetical protein
MPLEAENAALQLVVLRRRLHGRVRLTNHDRLFSIQLYRWFECMVRPRVARGFVNQRFDFARWPLDTLIQPAPVSRQILDDAQHARQEHIGARREDSLVKACGCNARVDLCPLWTDRKNRDLGERLLLAAGSTDRCNTFCELLSWGLIEQGLSRSFI